VWDALPEELGELVDPDVFVLLRDDAAGEDAHGAVVPLVETLEPLLDLLGAVTVLRQEAPVQRHGEVAG
jgi:hypothetical protein